MPDSAAPARQQRIEAAMATLGPATAAAIAEHAQTAYSSTTPILRGLEAAGTARRAPGDGRTTLWTLTTTPAATTAPDGAATDIPPATAAPAPQTDTGTDPSTTPSAAEAPAGAVADPQTVLPTAGASRSEPAVREKGALRAEVLALLQSRPDAGYKVSEICKLLDQAHGGGRHKVSAGAVANALYRLAEGGLVVLTVNRPVTFQAVITGSTPATA